MKKQLGLSRSDGQAYMGDIRCTSKDLEASGGNRSDRFRFKQISECKPQVGVAEDLAG